MEVWCPQPDSNRHTRRPQILSLLRLPVSSCGPRCRVSRAGAPPQEADRSRELKQWPHVARQFLRRDEIDLAIAHHGNGGRYEDGLGNPEFGISLGLRMREQ